MLSMRETRLSPATPGCSTPLTACSRLDSTAGGGATPRPVLRASHGAQLLRDIQACSEAIKRGTAYSSTSIFIQKILARYTTPELLSAGVQHLAAFLHSAQVSQFPMTAPCVVVACPGRDRVFGGHTDSPGLGGPTLNAACAGLEILAIAARQTDHTLTFTNDDTAYPAFTVNVRDILRAADAVSKVREPPGPAALAAAAKAQVAGPEWTARWHAHEWESYVSATLVFMCSEHYSAHARVRHALQGAVVHVCSQALPAAAGLSSSAALMGAVSASLSTLLGWGLDRTELAAVDLCEYLLMKHAGVADKVAELQAVPHQASLIGSFPDTLESMAPLCSQMVAVVAHTHVVRLSTPGGKAWLQDLLGAEAGALAAARAQAIMQANAAPAYCAAVQALLSALRTPQPALLTDEERSILLQALTTSSATKPLLRELALGGALCKAVPDTVARHSLVLRALQLIPERDESSDAGLPLSAPAMVCPRAAAAYGIAETERVRLYAAAHAACAALPESAWPSADALLAAGVEALPEAAQRALQLVRAAHDGDRAVLDVRTGEPTAWADTLGALHLPADWLAAQAGAGADLALLPGSFQRSVVELDDAADDLRQSLHGLAELRVAGAGLGGTAVIHAPSAVLPQVLAWCKAQAWPARVVNPGPGLDVLAQ